MIRSMTAFARQQGQAHGVLLCWELRSINHRYAEIAVHVPDDLRALESAMRELAGQLLKRGKIDCRLRLQAAVDGSAAGAESYPLRVNQKLVRQLVEATRQTGELMADPAPFSALEVLRWPGVLEAPEADNEQLGSTALSLLKEAVAELVAAREREGAKIMLVLEQRCQSMQDIVAQVRQKLPGILAQLRSRLLQRFGELRLELDPARLEQEMLMLVQKIDIDEELERLAMHISEVGHTLHSAEPQGRRLDFLMQELNREANTLGAKSVDADTTRASIDLKVIIEQMREQIQNIE